MITTEQVTYYVADALGIPLFVKPQSGKTRGASPLSYVIGDFWEEQVDMVVESDDILNAKVASYIVRLSGSLWLYLVAERTGGRMWLYLLDGDQAGLRIGELSVHLTGSADRTLKNLEPSIRSKFKYEDKAWKPW